MPDLSPHYRDRGAKQVAKKAVLKKDLEPLLDWIPTHSARVALCMLEVNRAAGIISWDKAIEYGKKQTVVYLDEFINHFLGYEEMAMTRVFRAYLRINTPHGWEVELKPSRRNISGGYCCQGCDGINKCVAVMSLI